MDTPPPAASLRRFLAAAALLTGLLLAAPVRADEAPQARRYMDWVFGCLAKTEAQMPAITRAAERAAEPYTQGGKFVIRGGVGLEEELMGRSGGFCAINRREKNATDKTPDIVLYALGVTPAGGSPRDNLAAEIDDAASLKKSGQVVIAIASVDQLKSFDLLKRAEDACDALLDNSAPAEDGLFRSRENKAIIPTHTVANAVVAWTWCAELFAACTRKGYTPVMYQSIVLDRKSERFNKYKDFRFHENETVDPVPAGTLGREYLTQVKSVLRDVSTTSWPAIVRTARVASDTLIDGGNVYVWTLTHYTHYHHGGKLAADPGSFKAMNATYQFLAKPGDNDLAIVVGYCHPPGAPGPYVKDAYGDTMIIRRAGRGVAWVINGYQTNPDVDLMPNEWIVDQRWAEGDAVVKVKGYDIPILPSSGVVAEAMMWTIHAQAFADYEDHLKHVKTNP